MDKKYKEMLRKTKTKQSLSYLLFGIEWKDILIAIGCAILVGINTIILHKLATKYNIAPTEDVIGKDFAFFMYITLITGLGALASALEVCAVILTYGILLKLYDAIFEFPIFLRTRKMPLTKEELAEFNFETDSDFYDFLFQMCSYKPLFYKGIKFAECMENYADKMLMQYNELKGYENNHIGSECDERLRMYLECLLARK